MLGWIKDRARTRSTARELYGAVVAQARNEDLYRRFAVPDTVEGRFEMIAVHLFLVTARLKALGEGGRRLSQHLVEAFVTDMDDTMREMGVSDLGVPRKVKRAAAALYDRLEAYGGADAAGGAALEEALGRLAYAGGDGDAPALANYMRRAAAALAGQADGEIAAGRLQFPRPAE